MGYSGFLTNKDVSGNPSVSAQDLDDRYQFIGHSNINEFSVTHTINNLFLVTPVMPLDLRGSSGILDSIATATGDITTFDYTYSAAGRHLEVFLNGVLLVPTIDYNESSTVPYTINLISSFDLKPGDILTAKGRVVNA